MNNEVQEVNEVEYEELAQLGNAITEGMNAFEKEMSKVSEEMNKRCAHLEVAARLKGSLDYARKVLDESEEFEERMKIWEFIKKTHSSRRNLGGLIRKQKRCFVYPSERFELTRYDLDGNEVEGLSFKVEPPPPTWKSRRKKKVLAGLYPYLNFWYGLESLDAFTPNTAY